jgi:hypothetical protein
MLRTAILWALLVLPSILPLSAAATDLRTYQFSTGNDRPFIYDSSWGLVVNSHLKGSFDLALDQSAGTAQLLNLNIQFDQLQLAPPRQNDPLPPDVVAFFNTPFTNIWPNNLTTLPGRFAAPNVVEFDGPTVGIFLIRPAGSARPNVTYTGSPRYVAGYNSAFQLKLDGNTAIISAATTNYFGIDFPQYFIVDATATLVPEPATAVPFAISLSIFSWVRRRRAAH